MARVFAGVAGVLAVGSEIVVLYAGRVVEQGPLNHVLAPPYHPYTRLLLRSVPELRQGWLEQVASESTPPPPRGKEGDTPGCPFQPRCPMAIRDVCDRQPPPVHQLPGEHRIACHRQLAELA